MNHYRIRLIIGSACTSAALTVLLLDTIDWLQPRQAPLGVPLFAAEKTQGRAELSPLRIDCSEALARVNDPSGEGEMPSYLLDDHRRLLACVPATATLE